MQTESDFLIVFPCFILAATFNKDGNTGVVILDEQLRFIAPEGSDGEQRVAIFTDEHLADEFRELIAPHRDLHRLQLVGPKSLKRFLSLCVGKYRQVAFDLNPKTGGGQFVDIEKLLRDMERLPDHD